MGFLLPLIGWPIAVALSALAVWSTWDIFHDELWRSAAQWVTPLPFATLAVACLTALGALPVLDGTLAAVALAALTALALWRAPSAARYILWYLGNVPVHLAGMAGRAPGHLIAVFRWVVALTRQRGAAKEAKPVPVRATPGVPPWKRTVPGVPSVLNDPALGPVPAPSEVAAALAAASVMVPATWAAVAAEAADHDPETDDEHVEHMDGEVAGVLTWSEAAMARAETLGDVAGLDPAYINAQFEAADAIADLASFLAQVSKRYHDTYDDMREAADGKPLPAKRNWFNNGGTPQDGRAA